MMPADVSRETWRHLVPGDALLIQSLATRIWWQVYPSLIGEAQVDYMLQEMYAPAVLERELRNGIDYVVLSVANQAVGFYALECAGETARLHKLYLDICCHGRGLGQRLISHAEARAIHAGAEALDLTVNKYNAPAIKAYRRAGFEVVDAFVKDIGNGFVMDDYRMCKMLADGPSTEFKVNQWNSRKT